MIIVSTILNSSLNAERETWNVNARADSNGGKEEKKAFKLFEIIRIMRRSEAYCCFCHSASLSFIITRWRPVRALESLAEVYNYKLHKIICFVVTHLLQCALVWLISRSEAFFCALFAILSLTRPEQFHNNIYCVHKNIDMFVETIIKLMVEFTTRGRRRRMKGEEARQQHRMVEDFALSSANLRPIISVSCGPTRKIGEDGDNSTWHTNSSTNPPRRLA